jgi:hypothetical protein
MDERDDSLAFKLNVQRGQKVVARMNDTADGIVIEHGQRLYEIPNERLQHSIPLMYGELQHLQFGQENVSQVQFDSEGRLKINPNSENTISIHWRSHRPTTYDTIISAFADAAFSLKSSADRSFGEVLAGNRISYDVRRTATRQGIEAIISPNYVETLLTRLPESERVKTKQVLFRQLEDFLIRFRSTPPVTGVDAFEAMFGVPIGGAGAVLGSATGAANPMALVPAVPAVYEVGRNRPDTSNHIENNLRRIVSNFTRQFTPARAAHAAAAAQHNPASNSFRRRIGG